MQKKYRLLFYLSFIMVLGSIISPKTGNCQSFQYIDLNNQYTNFNIQYNDLFNNFSLYNNPMLNNFQLPDFNYQSTGFTAPYNDFNTHYNSSFTPSLFNPLLLPIFGGLNFPFGGLVFNPGISLLGLNVLFGGFIPNWCPYSIPPPITPTKEERKYSRDEAEEMCDYLEGFLEKCMCIEQYTGVDDPFCI